jgi:hypothetical protein
MFDHLMAEVAEINQVEGWVGCFDAISYIHERRDGLVVLMQSCILTIDAKNTLVLKCTKS